MISKFKYPILGCCLLFMMVISTMNQVNANSLPDITQAQWLVLGPLDNPSVPEKGVHCQGFNRDYLSSIGGEAGARPKPGERTAGQSWRTHRATSTEIDFKQIFGPVENCLAYAYLEIKSDRTQKVALKLGSDDGAKVWLNGALVWNHHVHRSMNFNDDAITVQLTTGTNRLLLKVDQGNGGWGFAVCLRSIDKEILDWKQVKYPAYQLILNDPLIPKPSRITGIVATKPGFAVSEQVELKITDFQGGLLVKKLVRTGEFISLALPGDYTGICQFFISGTGSQSVIKSDPTVALIGDSQKNFKAAVTRARQIAKLMPFNGRGEDVAATLTFLADQLEGKVHSSLSKMERKIRAVQTIGELTQKAETILNQSKKSNSKPTWQVGTFTGLRQWAYRSEIDNSCQPYSLYLPKDYHPQKKYRLVICLHGYSGDDYGAASLLSGLQPADFIIVAPFGRGDLAYRSLGEQDVLDVLNLMQQTYSINPDQVYLTGWSMGGCGTWRIGQLYSDRFASIAPFCGWTGTEYLRNLINVPTLIVHGDADSTVPIFMDQAAADRLQDMGYPVRFDELPGVGHDAWAGWIKDRDGNRLLEYFRKFSRNPWPRKINLAATHLRYGKQNWVKILELTKPLITGNISSEVLDARHIRIDTNNVSVFSIDLRHPFLAQNGRILLELDGYGLAVDAGQESCLLEYSKELQKFVNLRKQKREIAPHDGGGLADLFYGPVYIVYGTMNSKRREILHRMAVQLGDWSQDERIFAGTKVGKLRVMEDKAMKSTDIRRANLLLLGTTAENSLLAKVATKLPVDLDNGRIQINSTKFTNAGLLLTYPNPLAPNRLLGIISLPQEADEIEKFIFSLRMNLRLYGLGPDDVKSFTIPDVVVLNTANEVKWQGTFNYRWKNLSKIEF